MKNIAWYIVKNFIMIFIDLAILKYDINQSNVIKTWAPISQHFNTYNVWKQSWEGFTDLLIVAKALQLPC